VFGGILSPLDLANKYMDIFYSSGAISELEGILAPNCVFEGPFYQFDNAKAYIDSLIKSPPRDMKADILESYENDHSACLIYKFSKSNVSCDMCQRFEIENGMIVRITLIFDTGRFTKS